MYKTVIIGGFGRSGTGAVHQLLRKHKDIYAFPNYEFRLITDPDGLLSLKSAIVDNWNIFQSDFALQRFTKLHKALGSAWTSPYINANYSKLLGESFSVALQKMMKELNVSSYKGVWAGRNSIINKTILKIVRHNKWFINKHIYYCPNISEDNFYKISTNFIQNMHTEIMLKSNKNMILLNEPNSVLNPKESLNLTGSKQLIIIYRDPRDSFASFLNKDWTPHSIDMAVDYMKLVYTRWLQQKGLVDKRYLLEIKLEDLVFEKKSTINKIAEFLQISIDETVINKSKFSPKKAHIGRWKNEFSQVQKEKINNAFSEILSYYGYNN